MNSKLLVPFCVVLLFPSISIAQEADDAKLLKQAGKQAQAMADATLKENYETVIKLTFKPALESIGGSEKALEAIKTQMNQMKSGGMVIEGFKLGDPKDLGRTPEYVFAIIPTFTQMTIPNAEVKADSYLLGISEDKGKTWLFIDGAGLNPKPKWLPKLPEKYELPTPIPPKIKAK